MREIIHEAMARALFVCAWADAMEEAGKLPGQCELMDVAPETSFQALDEAKKLYFDIEQANDVHLDEFVPPGYTVGGNAADEYVLPGFVPCEDGNLEEEELQLWDTEQARLFGHYLAMEALGHGVSWADDNDDHGLKVPNIDPYIYINTDDEEG